MFDRLAEIERRFEDLERLVVDPAVIADRREFAKLARERAQHLQRLRLVLVLRLLVLTRHDDARRDVRDAHGGVRRVDALPARPRRPIDVDAEILLGKIDLDVLGFRQDGDRDGGGVDPALRLGHRDALDAMHAALELEPAEGASPLD